MNALAGLQAGPAARSLPCLLAFDTSTEALALAVTGPHGVLCRTAPGGAAASASLLPQVQGLLQQAGLPMQALQAVAFGRGPGAFTGLRTSCAVAQGLAWGLGLPVLPIDSLLIVAEDARAQWLATSPELAAGRQQDFAVDVAVDARMAQAYCASYAHDGQAWHCTEPAALVDLSSLGLRARWRAGSAWALRADLTQPGQPPAWAEQDRAAALARLALAAWAAGQGTDPGQALPLYVRDRVALTTAERMAAREQA